MTAYYQLLERTQNEDGSTVARYLPNIHAQGAWNEHEQHMAPATGVLVAELVQYQPRDEMLLARVSLDILGLIHLAEFTIETRCIRPGRTIELIESTMTSQGRTCIIARAWRLQRQDSQPVLGLEDQPLTYQPDDLEVWTGMRGWPGGYIQSVQFKVAPDWQAGRGVVWLSTELPMVAGQSLPDMVSLLGLVDTANGIAPRLGHGLETYEWMFPNVDLQIHMHRQPTGKWLGLEAVQQYGSEGIGLTSTVLHDEHGPFGRSEQILTIRPMPKLSQ